MHRRACYCNTLDYPNTFHGFQRGRWRVASARRRLRHRLLEPHQTGPNHPARSDSHNARKISDASALPTTPLHADTASAHPASASACARLTLPVNDATVPNDRVLLPRTRGGQRLRRRSPRPHATEMYLNGEDSDSSGSYLHDRTGRRVTAGSDSLVHIEPNNSVQSAGLLSNPPLSRARHHRPQGACSEALTNPSPQNSAWLPLYGRQSRRERPRGVVRVFIAT